MYEMVFRKVEAGLVPRLKALPGFRLYCAFLSEEGEGLSVTVFDDREHAARANAQVLGWVRDNLLDLLPDPPSVIAGECGIAEAGARSGRGQAPAPLRRGPGVRESRPARGGARGRASAHPAPHRGARPGSGPSACSATSGSPRGEPWWRCSTRARTRCARTSGPCRRSATRRRTAWHAFPRRGWGWGAPLSSPRPTRPRGTVRPPHGGPLLMGRRSQRRRRGRPRGMAPPDERLKPGRWPGGYFRQGRSRSASHWCAPPPRCAAPKRRPSVCA